MGIINRFLLFVSMIGLALLSVLVLVLCMGVLPESIWLNEIHYILSRRETVAVSVVLLLVALHLLGVSLRGRAERTHERGRLHPAAGGRGRRPRRPARHPRDGRADAPFAARHPHGEGARPARQGLEEGT